jgi:hypothetical protein
MSVVAVVAVGGVLAGTMLANAAAPALPARTPAQLLADMQGATAPKAFSGVITENANLGLPSLPNIAGLSSSTLSAANWISGTHTVDVWYGGPRQLRIAVPVSFGETDLRVAGSEVWLWNSRTQTATHYLLPKPVQAPVRWKVQVPAPGKVPAPAPASRSYRSIVRCFASIRRLGPGPNASAKVKREVRAKLSKCLPVGPRIAGPPILHRSGLGFAALPMTPQQIATKILAAVGPTTKVSVTSNAVVAGRPVYQLVVAPRTDQSLIGRVVISVDSATYLPLQVQVFARGQSSPAFSVGFTALSFSQPAASNFSFTPPAGAHVKTVHLSGSLTGATPLGFGSVTGAGAVQAPVGGPVLAPQTAVGTRVIKIKIGTGKKDLMISARKLLLAGPKLRNYPGMPVIRNLGNADGRLLRIGDGSAVLGQGWLSVLVIPAGAPSTTAVISSSYDPTMPAEAGTGPDGGPTVGYTSRDVIMGPGGPGASAAQIAALLHVLMNAATPVHGRWGSGRLLRTSLFSVLFTNQGSTLIGAVTPAVLFADAAKVK